MSAPPAWIAAWEEGYAAGARAREEGKTLEDTVGAPAERPTADVQSYMLGFREALTGEVKRRPLRSAQLAIALFDAAALEWMGRDWRRAVASTPVSFGLQSLADRLPRRPADRDREPPMRMRPGRLVQTIAQAQALNCDARRRGLWPRSAATTLGTMLGRAIVQELDHRRDTAAWRAHRGAPRA